MPFGKYRGELLEDLPHSYLAWLHELPSLRKPLQSAVNGVWSERFDEDQRDLPIPEFPDEERALIRQILEAGERKMHRPERNSAKSNKSPFGSQDSTQRQRRFIQWRLSNDVQINLRDAHDSSPELRLAFRL